MIKNFFTTKNIVKIVFLCIFVILSVIGLVLFFNNFNSLLKYSGNTTIIVDYEDTRETNSLLLKSLGFSVMFILAMIGTLILTQKTFKFKSIGNYITILLSVLLIVLGIVIIVKGNNFEALKNNNTLLLGINPNDAKTLSQDVKNTLTPFTIITFSSLMIEGLIFIVINTIVVVKRLITNKKNNQTSIEE